jgi:HK97 family phage major capsid protein
VAILTTQTAPTGVSLSPEERGELILKPLQRDSLALRTATVLTTVRDQLAVPVLTDDVTGADVVAEGALLPEGEPNVVERTLRPVKFAVTSPLSNEIIGDGVPDVIDLFGDSMARAVRRKMDSNYLLSDGTGLAPAGVLKTAGVVDGGTLGTNLDAISDAVSEIEGADGRADVIVMNPSVWGTLSKLKVESASNAPLLGSPSAPAATQSLDPERGRSLFGVQVYTDPLVPADTVGVWDSRAVAVALREDVRYDVDFSVAFKTDSAIARVVVRAAWEVLFPERVVTIAVA